MFKINNIKAYEILDSRGIPTLMTEVSLDNNVLGTACVPSGASTGVHEAIELRDKDLNRYKGKGVLNNIKFINSVILEALQGLDVREQNKIDNILIELDGTLNKKKLGANTILSVSIAIAKAASKAENIELYSYLGGLVSNRLPIPLVNVINGGAHAANNLDIQEYMLAPLGANTFGEAIRWCSEIFYNLKDILIKNKKSTAVGDEGGFASNFNNNTSPIEYIIKAIKASKLNPEKDVLISLDVAATEFYKNKKYFLSSEKKHLNGEEMIIYLDMLKNKFPIFSIEDGCAEDDWKNWINLTKRIGNNTLLIGDDLFVTNTRRLHRGIKEKAANGILIKPNQIGTLTETIETINLAKENSIENIISHRSGETEDSFIADLCIATNSKFIKTGSVSRSERCSKYNRLIYIEKNNPNYCYSGINFNV